VIHCDTSFLIRAAVPRTSQSVALRQWVKERRSLAVSAIAWGEYLCGPVSDAERRAYEELLGAPIAFVPAASEVAAHLFNVSGRRRGTFTDCLIAASAIVEGAEFVTVNTAHFVRMVPVGLRLVELDAE